MGHERRCSVPLTLEFPSSLLSEKQTSEETQQSSFLVNTPCWQCCHFCIACVGKLKISLVKKVPLVRIEPGTLGLGGSAVLHSHAFLTGLTWQELIEGYLT